MSENGEFLQVPVMGTAGGLKIFEAPAGAAEEHLAVEVRYNKAGVVKLLCVKVNNKVLTKMEFV